MIQSIRHRGLKRLFEDDDESGVSPEHVGKLKNILATRNAAATNEHMNLPGFRLHPLKGEMKGFGCGYFGTTLQASGYRRF